MLGKSGLSGLEVKVLAKNVTDVGSNPPWFQFFPAKMRCGMEWMSLQIKYVNLYYFLFNSLYNQVIWN